MAELFIDGFDKYGPAGLTNTTLLQSLLTATEWTSISASSASCALVASLSATGAALALSAGSGTFTLTKSFGANYTRLIGGVRFSSTLVNPAAIQFLDGASNQCAIVVNTTTGTISVTNGTYTGTVLGTSGASVSAGTTHYLEWDITFGNSASYQLWLDGTSILSGTGYTQATANARATGFSLIAGRVVGASVVFTVDDLYLFDTTGSTNNAVLLTNPRVETTVPTADSAAAFLFGAGVLGAAAAYQGVTTTNAPGANQLFLRKYTPKADCTLNSLAIVPGATSGTAKFKAVAYADSAGAPGSLLSSGTEVVGCTSGSTLTAALITPQSLTAGTPCWIGFITDTSVVLQQADAGTAGYKVANTYASGAPGTAPAMTGGQASWLLYGNVSGIAAHNWLELANNPALGDLSYVYSDTVNDEDLFTFGSLSVNPDTIYTVAVKGNIRREAGGSPTLDFRAKSGGTTSSGGTTGIGPGATYEWRSSFFPTDPNTGVAWTASGLNAATSGMKIAS